MVELKEPDLGDKQWIMELSRESNLRSADYSFGIIYCWSGMMEPMIARVGDRLFLRNTVGGEVFYAWPVGKGDMGPVLEAMRADADSLGVPFQMCCIPEDRRDEAAAFFSKAPEFTLDKRFSDYVYRAESLATLSGKKLHQKKNHLNRFMAENQWSFEPITKDNIAECQELSSQWFIANSDERDAGYTSEIRALYKTFEHYFELGFDGGLIRVSGEPAAFTIGELMSDDTFVTHFEKAHHHANGGYTIINQQFAVYLLGKYPGLVYINREEDMGFENLRKAKESYHPEFLLDKYMAVWRF